MQKAPLTYQQQLRYSRHIMLPQLDIDGQEKLWQSHALVVGVGGLGCAVSQYLAASGVGTLTLVDNDEIDVTNLQRQILYKESDIGSSKCSAAKKQLNALNSEIDINTIEAFFDVNTSTKQLFNNIDIVIDCSDNLATRNALNNACFKAKVPLVSGSAIRMEGQVACFTMDENSHCAMGSSAAPLIVRCSDRFFKQKTAYAIPSCDWSSDVCSSDLIIHFLKLAG